MFEFEFLIGSLRKHIHWVNQNRSLFFEKPPPFLTIIQYDRERQTIIILFHSKILSSLHVSVCLIRYPRGIIALMSNPTWRLLLTPPATGAWNMAVDEAILESTGSQKTPPTLRLYAWQPPCLSLGYAQSANEVDFAALNRLGWQIVRRPTGGRAILHTDELTYSVITPPDDPIMAGGVLESYRRLAQALLHALHILGLQAAADARYPTTDTTPNGPVCFEVPSNYEITVAGKKLLGSAQARRSQGILQHGSFPLHGDLTRITQALVFPDEEARQRAAQRLLAHAATAADYLTPPPTWQQAAQAFQSAFAETLGLNLVPGELSLAEHQRAQTLQAEKYAADSWTMRL